MRQVERAIFDIRRGLPVLLRDEAGDTLVHPIEGIGDEQLRKLTQTAGCTPGLVLTAHRLAAMGHNFNDDRGTRGGRLRIEGVSDSDTLTLLAASRYARGVDGDTWQALTMADEAALAMMRRALLIPAAITARIDPEQSERIEQLIAEGELLAVSAESARACQNSTVGLLGRISEAEIPLVEAERTRFILFREPDGLREHIAVVIGDPEQWDQAVPVRLHSACLTGDLFGSLRCDCGEQLRNGVDSIQRMGGGVLLYLAQEGRGIGLANKLRAYAMQDEGLDTIDADQVLGFGEDERHYAMALDILIELGIRRIQLLTNNPAKLAAMNQGGIEVVNRQGIYGRLTNQNHRYLTAKAHRAGHLLDEVLDEQEETGSATFSRAASK
ncbi:GTP cyclohydrolase II RibA [Kushneria phosphatilytica]|uniref:GTP cyclohydrolase-2 n=1 Tax=Kushneria phosphatilytica TaxID=657387 RepID=A0A1S1NZ65_9GAMM|nr:GTP cyclohydrolase II RibA [Kushneria phosphatilytica]OHV12163.1 GTP cyclohydrolase [Kushneria phosphatilytica]QEL11355.1 GTP cyclohydrolase II RibA [Kushneria phosphatilytica]